MKRFFLHNIRILCLLMIMSVTMSSCIEDNGDCSVVNYHDKEGLKISFHITTKNGGTRAADLYGGDFDYREGSGAENFLSLNTSTLRYLIFDRDQRYICDITPDATTVSTNSFFTLYDVVAKLDDEYFIENINDVLDFYILVIANANSFSQYWGLNLPELSRGVTTIQSLCDNGLLLTTAPKSASTLMQSVTNATSSRFPMVGLQHFSFHGSMLLTTTDGLPYDISLASGKNINLLRALAKIEIIDKINISDEIFNQETDGDSGYRIWAAKMNGYMTQGSLLPTYNQWTRNVTYPETQQVIAPSVPNVAEYSLPPSLNNDFSIGSTEGLSDFALDFAKDDVATEAREDKCPVFSCYVYEYAKLPDTEIPANQLPYFTVTIKGSDNPQIESLTFPMRMAKYSNGSAPASNNLDELLRNHIYRFEITGIQQNLNVNWTVCKMDQATTEIEFK